MKLLLALVGAMLFATPSAAQTISGCSSVASNRIATSTDKTKLQSDVDCFGRASTLAIQSAKVRADRIEELRPLPPVVPPKPVPVPTPTPTPTPPVSSDPVDCAAEDEVCKGTGWGEVIYGANGITRRQTVNGDVLCSNDALGGDPLPGVVKRCSRRPVAAPLMPSVIKPIASNFDTSKFILSGVGIPGTGYPDVVGAFRMICTAGQLNYDDPILYPGVLNGSPHLHQWFGNLTGRYDSTYASLRLDGESTCSNKLNRSAYWVVALKNAAGKVITPDYISLYYKRRPANDPECFKQALKGCVGLPVGLRVVSGYDMKRMGQKQPENQSFHFRCISPNKPSEHRNTIGEAITDCGGSGQVMAAIGFGDCWNGMLDSADHRSHLTGGSYGGWGYLKCPASHPYVIEGLTQGVAYTIEADDGEVYFDSDRMNGMKMVGGSTFHADYMEAWDPPTRLTWEEKCIDGFLSCSDGTLGDGTMILRGNLTYKAAQRLVTAPPLL